MSRILNIVNKVSRMSKVDKTEKNENIFKCSDQNLVYVVLVR